MTASSAVQAATTQVSTQAVVAAMRDADIGFSADNFAVWHCYMTGTNPTLKRAIDVLLSNGMPVDDRTLNRLYARHFCQMRDARALGDAVRNSLYLFNEVSETLFPLDPPDIVHASRSRLFDGLGEMNRLVDQFVRQLVLSEERIAQLEQFLDDAKREASTDSLTNVANRRAFDSALRTRAGNAMNDGSDVGFVLIDIDHFKTVNDRWGHSTGDAVLRTIAETLTRSVGKGDVVARYGGEEFAVILPDSGEHASLALADELRRTVELQAVDVQLPGAPARERVQVTVSAGVSCYRPGESLSQWLGRGDMALYQAKNEGRNRVVFGGTEPPACNVVSLSQRASG